MPPESIQDDKGDTAQVLTDGIGFAKATPTPILNRLFGIIPIGDTWVFHSSGGRCPTEMT
jgi:hypothetical protein